MLKVAAYSKVAVEAGIIPAEQMRRVLAQYKTAGADAPFEQWALAAGVLSEAAVDRLLVAYGKAQFRCTACLAKCSGSELVGETDAVCPHCGNGTFRRVRSTQDMAAASLPTEPAADPSEPPAGLAAGMRSTAAEFDATVAASRDAATAFEIRASGSGNAHPVPPHGMPATSPGSLHTIEATGAEPTPDDFERGLKPGQRIGNWEIIRMAGRGGMGAVYQARNPDLDQYAAIKVLNANFLDSSQQVARFREEARACAKLEHPNIIQVKDFGTLHGRAYLILQWVEGGSIGDRLKQFGPLPVPDFLDIAIQVCRGLSEAHAHGIIHRDIKPDNLMISAKDGRVKVADFGLAKSLEAKEGLTATGAFLGTPAFMAPEQINNESIGPTTDIYALGGTFYTMLTGRVPFKAGSVATVLHMHIAQPFPDVREVQPDVPADLAQLLQRMCAKKQHDRIATMDEVAAVLEGLYSQLTAGGDRLAELNRRMGGITSSGPSMVSSRAGGLMGDTLDSADRVRDDDEDVAAAGARAGAQPRPAAGRPTGTPQRTAASPQPESGGGEPVRRRRGRAAGLLLLLVLLVGAAGALYVFVLDPSLLASADDPERPDDEPVHPDDEAEADLEALALEFVDGGTAAAAREMVARIEAALQGQLSRPRRIRLERARADLVELLPALEVADRLHAQALAASDERQARDLAGEVVAFLEQYPRMRARLGGALAHLEEVLGEPVAPATLQSVAEWMQALRDTAAEVEAALAGESYVTAQRAAANGRRLLREVDAWIRETRQGSDPRLVQPRSDLQQVLQAAAEYAEAYMDFERAMEEAETRLVAVEDELRGTRPDLQLVREAQAAVPERVAELEQMRLSPIGHYREVAESLDSVIARLQAIGRFDVTAALPPEAALWLERARVIDSPVAAVRFKAELQQALDANPAWEPFFGPARSRLDGLAAATLPPVEGRLDPNLPANTARFQNAGPAILRWVVDAEVWGDPAAVRDVVFVGDGRRLVAAVGQATLNVVELGNNTVERSLPTGGAAVVSLAVNDTGTALVAGGTDGVARIYNALRWGTPQTIDLYQNQGAVTALAHSSHGGVSNVVVGTAAGRASVVDQFLRGTEHLRTSDTTRPLHAAAVTRNGRWLALGGEDAVLRFYEMPDLSDGRKTGEGVRHLGPIRTVAASPTSQYFVSGSDDGTLIVWNASNQREVVRLLGHGSAVTACAFTANGRYLISGSRDGTLRLWDTTDSWRCVLTINLHTDAAYQPTALTLTPDGQRLAVGTQRGDVLVFDLLSDWQPRRPRDERTGD